MYTIDEFTPEWKRLHHASMNVDGDVAFYYRLYEGLFRLAGCHTRRFDDAAFLPLLLYAENAIGTGVDGVYEYMYRSVGDVVSRWCEGLGLDAHATSQVHNLVSQAVAEAPCSALRRWVTESVLSGNFLRFSDMLTYSAREDKILQLVYPDLRFREAMFLRIAGNKLIARQMLWADIAFNWRDKRGNSLSATLANQCRLTAPLVDEQEREPLLEAAKVLETVRSEQLDTYTVVEGKGGCTLTLRHRDGRVFTGVTFPAPVSGNAQCRHLAAQLVTYMGKTYVNGPAVWLTDETLAGWNGDNIWSDILKKEQDAAKQIYFTTPFGKRISLYEDLYTVPEDPVETYYADMGIYPDEPNIFDFLEWLKPSEKTV